MHTVDSLNEGGEYKKKIAEMGEILKKLERFLTQITFPRVLRSEAPKKENELRLARSMKPYLLNREKKLQI